MSGLTRSDNSLIGRWWWTVDRWALAALFLLVGAGLVLVLAASPAVAERVGLGSFHFVQRQMVFVVMALVIAFVVSLMSPRGVRRLALLTLGAALVGLLATLVLGAEIKGATRWVRLFGFSVQPSEFLKPAFAVVCAWVLAQGHADPAFPGKRLALGLLVGVAGLLLLQPDLGQTVLIGGIWSVELFLAGIPFYWVLGLAIGLVALVIGAYFTLGHVQSRIDSFLEPGVTGYQVERGLQAFHNGGLFGTGPGEGHIKDVLPDAHADFIFAVAGEEFGLIACLIIVGLFLFLVMRGFARLYRDEDLFVLLAGAGLLTQLALQSLINMASSVHLIPPKGMTLPFISYGGSSTLALGLAMGMILALTRIRPRTFLHGTSRFGRRA
ncbi:MAG: FtsW/RodA/SpoVE family cell cycle protein [Rhodospirillales bacterium]